MFCMDSSDFDISHLDGLEEAERILYGELEEEQSEIRVRAGYDGAPVQHDIQDLLSPGSDRVQGVEKARDLYEFVDDFFGETQYVDWSLCGFEEYEIIETNNFEYGNYISLTVEVCESGQDGHDILRL